MVNINESDGVFVLEGDMFNLKIDNNRKIYVKKKNSSHYESIGIELDIGYSSEEKKKYLYNLYMILIERKKELPSTDKEQDK